MPIPKAAIPTNERIRNAALNTGDTWILAVRLGRLKCTTRLGRSLPLRLEMRKWWKRLRKLLLSDCFLPNMKNGAFMPSNHPCKEEVWSDFCHSTFRAFAFALFLRLRNLLFGLERFIVESPCWWLVCLFDIRREHSWDDSGSQTEMWNGGKPRFFLVASSLA